MNQNICELFDPSKKLFSFEFFPTRTPEAGKALWRTVGRLKKLNPTFVSVTYGAGGSTRDSTREMVHRMMHEYDLPTMAHLTCVGDTRDELRTLLKQYHDDGIRNLLALRGDPPGGTGPYTPVTGGCQYASELVELIHETNPGMCVGVAGFPETHPDARDPGHDIEVLNLKLKAGALFVITQLFYDNADYFDYVKRARAAGITVPVIPGVLPIISYSMVTGFIANCGARIPADLRQQLDAVKDDKDAVRQIGMDYATEQCAELLAGGAPGIHYYTVNRAKATQELHMRLIKKGLFE